MILPTQRITRTIFYSTQNILPSDAVLENSHLYFETRNTVSSKMPVNMHIV